MARRPRKIHDRRGDDPATAAAGPSAPASAESTRAPGLGLGCVTFGREIDRESSFAMMDHALGRGIFFLDTAAAYGGGASERIVGEWLASRGARNRVTLATKILPPYAPGAIEAAVAASERRLGVTTIDILFLHRWDETALAPDALRALDGLVRTGRAGAIGVSNFSSEQTEHALGLQAELGLCPFGALQNIHNVAVRGVDDGIRRLGSRAGFLIVTYSPLGAGFLTGKHERGVQPGSRFDIIPGHQDVYFNDLARRRLARLRATSTRSGVPMTRLALAWALHQTHVSTVLVGGRTPAHLDQAVEAMSFDQPALLRELDAD